MDPSRARREDVIRLAGVGVVAAVAYVLAARLGFLFAFSAEQVTTVWAPSGIAIAVLLLWGRALWPAVWMGAFAANAGTDAPLWTAAVVATGNTLEAVLATWALQQPTSFDPALRRTRDVMVFMIAAVLGSTVIAATIGATTLCAAGVQHWDRFLVLWSDWWLGDAMGVLIVAPVILTVARRPAWSWRERLETVALVAGVALITHVVFGEVFGRTAADHPLEFVIFPFVIAGAVRVGQPATALIGLTASIVSILYTVRGVGPFATLEVHQSLILLQVFMSVLAGTGLLLSAAIAERRTGERRRAAAQAVGEVLSAASDLDAAAPAVLDSLCTNLDWETGGLWTVAHGRPHLRNLCVRDGGDARLAPFTRMSREITLARGIGLPGRVWASGQPVWIEDVGRDPNFPRAAVAHQAGLRSAFAFPVRLDDEVIGVIECFSRSAGPPDVDLLNTMSTIGNQVGQFVARVDAERDRARLFDAEARARHDAEEANRAKDEFLATLSHELRTPLNAIVGWTRLLADDALDRAGARRAVEVINRNASQLTHLVGDILDVSRIIQGGMRLEIAPVDLAGCVTAALDAIRPAAEARQVRLISEIQDDARRVQGDARRLQQVVWNLLANAVKFTHVGGTVTITVVDAGQDAIQIRVRDDGIGIAPEFVPHVFERFRQGDGSITRQHGGLGLGLAIVRHLVELHGGSVRAESDGPGHGATFTVELPRLQAAVVQPSGRAS